MLPAEIVEDLEKVRVEIRTAQESLAHLLERSVRADFDYRLAKARAYLRADGSTISAKDAQVELAVAEDRLTSKLADGQVESAKQRLQSLRAELSALTSMAYLVRSEIELAR